MKLFDFFSREKKRKSPIRKKINPTFVIENTSNPELESVYVSFPGRDIEDVSLKREHTCVFQDDKKIKKLINKFGRYSHTHTHNIYPEEKEKVYFRNILIPSNNDWRQLLKNKKCKSIRIAQRNPEIGKTEGYLIIKKILGKKRKRKLKEGEYSHEPIRYKDKDMKSMFLSQELSRKMHISSLGEYGLHYRFVPAKGYVLDKQQGKFVKKENLLEKKVAGIISISGLGVAIFFLSSNITGSAIGSLNQTSSNWIGGILFVVGLIAGFFWLRKRKPEIHKIKTRKRRK